MHHHHAQALNPAFDPPAGGGWAGAAANALAAARHRATPERLALGLIAVISLGLGLIRIGQEGYGNAYYAAAVRSMLENWHAFFFASFDAKGFVTVDKPPMGLWIQTASAWLLGYHGWSILLPQILASTGSVLLIHAIVRKPLGAAAGLLAALALAIAPVNVAVARNNSSDDVLAFFMLLGGVCVLRAARQGSARWLAAAMAMLGLGFNVKMLEAYLALPAFLAVYFLAAAAPFWRRLWHLALATAVLVVVSFSWATVVALTPASARPYVGSTQDNNIFSLIFGYNGLNRLLPRGWSILGITSSTSSGFGGGIGGGVGGASENGAQGIFRLLDTQLGGQIGWLIPLAVVGLVVAWGRPSLRRFTDQQRVLLLLGVWAAVEITFFSVAGFYHRYYLATLSPAIAGLVGAGFVALWRNLARGGWRAFLLPAAVVLTAASQYRLLRDYPTWKHRLAPVLIAGAALAIIALLLRAAQRWHRLGELLRRGRVVLLLVAASVLALLAAPSVWSYTTTQSPGNATMPVAGPSAANFRGPFNGRAFAGGGANDAGAIDASMISYLEQHQGSSAYLLAVASSQQADQIIISTGKAVMAMGGFSGSDPILTVDQLKQLVAKGEVRYFMLGGRGGFGRRAVFAAGDSTVTGGGVGRAEGSTGSRGGNRPADDFESRGAASFGGFAGTAGSTQPIDSWIQQNCQAVSSTSSASLTGLYDCQAAAS